MTAIVPHEYTPQVPKECPTCGRRWRDPDEKSLTLEEQAVMLSRAIRAMSDEVDKARASGDLKLFRQFMNTLNMQHKALTDIQRAIVGITRRTRTRTVTELPVGGTARTSTADVAANG